MSSNAIFDEAFAAETASLERIVDPPTGNLGYGRDLSCVLDLTHDVAEVDPMSPTAIGQAVFRRLMTARGNLPDDPDYGIDVRGMLNRGIPVQKLRDLAGQIRTEITKDVTIPEPGALSVAINITPEVPGVSPFDLTMALTADTVELLL
jgi:hypothetical protein